MIWWTWTSALAGTCPAPTSVADLERRLDEAEQAYEELDAAGAVAALDRMGLDLPCVDSVVAAPTALRIHRMYALLAWGEGRQADATRSLAAMKRIDPEVILPDELVPPGHELHAALAEARPARPKAIPAAELGEILFDGAPREDGLPADPTVAQYVVDGAVSWTTRVSAGGVLPPYPMVQLEPPPSLAEPQRRRVAPTTVLAASAGALTAGLFGGAWLARASFDNYEPDAGMSGVDARSALDGRRTMVTALTVASGVSALGTGVLVVVAL
ncbi:MAG: hypothetical protein KC621_24435 [Myxococcales bacterium]|nr:hypothetical protein [Myxococcales bacterium]